MFSIFPEIDCTMYCPKCNTEHIKINALNFQGKFVLGDCICLDCDFVFYQTLPFGHFLIFPLTIDKTTQNEIHRVLRADWLHQPLLAAFQNPKKTVKIEKEIRHQYDEVVILHCLDEVYGHTFFRLLNAQRHLQNTPEIGLIVLIPKLFRWLVPENVAEIWMIDESLATMHYGFENFNDFVQGEFKRFKQVYWSYAFIQLDAAKIDISLFTKIPRFDLDKFHQSTPCITLIYREDRFWLCNHLDNFLHLVWLKYKSKGLLWQYLKRKQKQNLLKLSRIIRANLAEAQICWVGFGQNDHLPEYILDMRSETTIENQEYTWAKIYAQSHVVVGVHGSNLLLPSALAAACVELLPDFKLQNFAEASASPHQNRFLTFLYRIFPIQTKPQVIAAHSLQIIKDFSFFYLHTHPRFQAESQKMEQAYRAYIQANRTDGG